MCVVVTSLLFSIHMERMDVQLLGSCGQPQGDESRRTATTWDDNHRRITLVLEAKGQINEKGSRLRGRHAAAVQSRECGSRQRLIREKEGEAIELAQTRVWSGAVHTARVVVDGDALNAGLDVELEPQENRPSSVRIRAHVGRGVVVDRLGRVERRAHGGGSNGSGEQLHVIGVQGCRNNITGREKSVGAATLERAAKWRGCMSLAGRTNLDCRRPAPRKD